MRAAFSGVLGVLLALGAWSCGAQCSQVSPAPTSVCRNPGDGEVQVGVPFVLRAEPMLSGAECQVSVEAGELVLVLTGHSCTGASGARPVAPSQASCAVPALPAGTYTVKGTTVTFSVPHSARAPVPTCR